MTSPLFLVESLRVGNENVPLRDLMVGDRGILAGTEGHHARKSMRLSEGDQLQLCDTCGLRMVVLVVNGTDSGLVVEVLSVTEEAASEPALVLVQGLAKNARDEMAVETVTELGANRIIPWQASRSIVQWAGSKRDRQRQKWANIAWAATKQSRRAHLPVVEEVVSSNQLAERIAQTHETGGLTLVCDEEATQTLPEAFTAWNQHATAGALEGQQIFVVVGPEGGITSEERQSFQRAGAKLVSLGPAVLRSSTAGPVAFVLLSYLTGQFA